MSESYDKKYRPMSGATRGQEVLRELLIPASALEVDIAYTSNDLTVDFYGYYRQAFKVLPVHSDVAGDGPTMDVEIQEFVSDPEDPDDGSWATKGGLGIGSAAGNANDEFETFEHNCEDTMRLARIKLTPRVIVPDGGVRVEISGARR